MYQPRTAPRMKTLTEVQFCQEELNRNARLLWLMRAFVGEVECREFDRLLELIKVRLDRVETLLLKKTSVETRQK